MTIGLPLDCSEVNESRWNEISSSITPTFTGVIDGSAHNKNQNNIDDHT